MSISGLYMHTHVDTPVYTVVHILHTHTHTHFTAFYTPVINLVSLVMFSSRVASYRKPIGGSPEGTLRAARHI